MPTRSVSIKYVSECLLRHDDKPGDSMQRYQGVTYNVLTSVST